MEKKPLFGDAAYSYVSRHPNPEYAMATGLDEPDIQARLEQGNDA